jgi:hypothetical protein
MLHSMKALLYKLCENCYLTFFSIGDFILCENEVNLHCLGKFMISQLVNKFAAFMELECLSPYSQKVGTTSYM